MRVSFIGLGVMGYPMAGHLQKQVLTSRFLIVLRRKRWRGRNSLAGSMLKR